MTRTAQEWGRTAVSLPGWQWMRGMSILASQHNPAALVDFPPSLIYVSDGGSVERGEVVDDEDWPDPDDPATAGCLLALLESAAPRPYRRAGGLWVVVTGPAGALESDSLHARTLGRACIAAAKRLGRWPGGGA